MTNNLKSQLELTFTRAQSHCRNFPRQRRLRRAQWWFGQMRQVVDRALDRRPATPARPEQIYLVLTNARGNS